MRAAGGLTGMADKGGDKELPQRFRGEARAATSSSGSPVAPVLSAELRQRLETAVTAERAVAAARDQDRPTGGEVTTPSVRSGDGLGTSLPDARDSGRAAKAAPASQPENQIRNSPPSCIAGASMQCGSGAGGGAGARAVPVGRALIYRISGCGAWGAAYRNQRISDHNS